MEARVIRRFKDNKEKQVMRPKQTWTGTEARYQEINLVGQQLHGTDFLEAIEKPKKTKERKLKIETKSLTR